MKTGSKIQFDTPYSTKYTVAKSQKVKALDDHPYAEGSQ